MMTLRIFLFAFISLFASGCASIPPGNEAQYEQWKEDCSVYGLPEKKEDRLYNSAKCRAVRQYEREILWPKNTDFFDYIDYQHRQICSKDDHCQVVMTQFIGHCGPYYTAPLLYSTQVIRGKHRKRMLKLIADSIAKDKAKYEQTKEPIEECILTRPMPVVGVCWKNQCESLSTLRK